MKKQNELHVYFLNVGYAEATVILFPNGENMLIDTGTEGSFDRLCGFLQEKNITTIDYFLITHFHEDHTGGAKKILEKFLVKRLLISPDIDNPLLTDIFGIYLHDENVPFRICRKGDTLYKHGETAIHVLHPYEVTEDPNANSLVIIIQHNQQQIMLPGEIYGIHEEQLINEYGNALKSNVLRLGHHGWGKGNTMKWLDFVDPQYLVLSVGESEYPAPDEALIQLIEEKKLSLVRTDKDGTIHCMLSCNEENITIETEF